MPKQSFIIIGSGWRSEFYIRIAKALPEHFQLKALLCRSEEKVQYFTDTYGIKATPSILECIGLEPDFVVVAVNKSSIFEVTREWLQQGFPFLAETSAATSLEDLQSLWHLKESGAKIQIAEQYHRYPGIAARLAVLKSNLIGEPYNVVMKRAHEYHGISMIRDILSITDETVTITAQSFTFLVTETGNRSGAVYDGTIKEQTRNLVTLEFSYSYNDVGYKRLYW